jgi:hypothetical protein
MYDSEDSLKSLESPKLTFSSTIILDMDDNDCFAGLEIPALEVKKELHNSFVESPLLIADFAITLGLPRNLSLLLILQVIQLM